MIDKQKAENAFRGYTSRYDVSNTMIRHKVEHTFRVAENCERIAGSLGVNGEDAAFAWFLGLLHDIGRFEQVRRFGTFIDSVSVDHAEFGADLLFRDGLMGEFVDEGFPEQEKALLETAIRQHNKLTLPENLEERTRRFCEIIRDADKADIFHVVAELPFEERIGTSKGLFQEGIEASEAVMNCVLSHRCVPRALRKTRFEGHISHCCLAFELVFPETRRIVREQGFLSQMLAEWDAEGQPLWNERERAQLRVLQNEIEAAWGKEENEEKERNK